MSEQENRSSSAGIPERVAAWMVDRAIDYAKWLGRPKITKEAILENKRPLTQARKRSKSTYRYAPHIAGVVFLMGAGIYALHAYTSTHESTGRIVVSATPTLTPDFPQRKLYDSTKNETFIELKTPGSDMSYKFGVIANDKEGLNIIAFPGRLNDVIEKSGLTPPEGYVVITHILPDSLLTNLDREQVNTKMNNDQTNFEHVQKFIRGQRREPTRTFQSPVSYPDIALQTGLNDRTVDRRYSLYNADLAFGRAWLEAYKEAIYGPSNSNLTGNELSLLLDIRPLYVQSVP